MLCWRCQKKLKMVLHIFTHNFLNIQPILNPKKSFGNWDLGLSNTSSNTIYVKGMVGKL